MLKKIGNSGIYPNQATQCYEAWWVNAAIGIRQMISTCSMAVTENEYKWWSYQLKKLVNISSK